MKNLVGLTVELETLNDLINELVDFTRTPVFIDMPYSDRHVYLRQHSAMIDYRACLKERMKAFEE